MGAGGSRFKSGCPDFLRMDTVSHPNSFCHHYAADVLSSVVSADGIHAFASDVIITPFPFQSLIVSVNYTAQPDALLLLEVQVRINGVWSEFYKLGLFSKDLKSCFPDQQDAFGKVETDTLSLFSAAEAYRVRIHFKGTLSLQGFYACGLRFPFIYDEKKSACLPEGAYQTSVAPLSQMQVKHPDHRRICSPVSLCMALQTLGFEVSLKDVMSGVLDQRANIYGNWIFNTAYASEVGAESYVKRFSALAELKDYCREDSLVIASIAYEKNDLPGAPMERTDGHLVLIRGYEPGQILVADPAASTNDTVLRTYEAVAFAKAWLERKQGVAYIVRKK